MKMKIRTKTSKFTMINPYWLSNRDSYCKIDGNLIRNVVNPQNLMIPWQKSKTTYLHSGVETCGEIPQR
jgi:hypothetical protein